MQSQASDNTAILVDGSGSLVPANWVAFDTNAFTIYRKNGTSAGLLWGGAGSCRGMGGAWGDCDGLTRMAVRYDSPTWSGFSVSASFGDDDFWDVAARYAGEWNGIKISVAAAYNQWTDGNTCNGNNQSSGNSTLNALGVNCITGSNALSGTYPNPGQANYFQAGLYVEHVPTGLWGMVDYGHLDDNVSSLPATDTWYFKAGLRERWTHLGHTVLYGEYLRNDDGNNINICGAGVAGTASAACNNTYDSTLHVWGLGVVQEVDAAAMSLWISYRHLSLDDNLCGGVTGITCTTNETFGYHSFQYVKFGGLINF
jgi:hypothetical protein